MTPESVVLSQELGIIHFVYGIPAVVHAFAHSKGTQIVSTPLLCPLMASI